MNSYELQYLLDNKYILYIEFFKVPDLTIHRQLQC